VWLPCGIAFIRSGALRDHGASDGPDEEMRGLVAGRPPVLDGAAYLTESARRPSPRFVRHKSFGVGKALKERIERTPTREVGVVVPSAYVQFRNSARPTASRQVQTKRLQTSREPWRIVLNRNGSTASRG